MPYNGVGLHSARGSGTSGYVESNLSAKNNKTEEPSLGFHGRRRRNEETRRRQINMKTKTKKIRSARKEIDLHNEKRKVELACAKLRARLEEKEETEESINKHIEKLRSSLDEKIRSKTVEENNAGEKEAGASNYEYKRRYDTTNSPKSIRRQN